MSVIPIVILLLLMYVLWIHVPEVLLTSILAEPLEHVTVSRAKERILERLWEKQDRRTPVPVTSFLSSW